MAVYGESDMAVVNVLGARLDSQSLGHGGRQLDP
jgi:hypothetical protein